MHNLFNFGHFCPVLVEIQNFEVSLVEFRCYPSDIIVHVQVYRYVGFGSFRAMIVNGPCGARSGKFPSGFNHVKHSTMLKLLG